MRTHRVWSTLFCCSWSIIILTAARRRAIFLSRVLAPPSPTATLTPKTPPDSPAIFHYTLPSPGLVSPLTHLETLGRNSIHGPISFGCKPWIEQVDFRSSRYSRPIGIDGTPRSSDVARDHKGMPSLDQISARISARVSTKRATRLPALLSPSHIPAYHELDLPVGVDKLSMPMESSKLNVCIMVRNVDCHSHHQIYRPQLLWLCRGLQNLSHVHWILEHVRHMIWS